MSRGPVRFLVFSASLRSDSSQPAIGAPGRGHHRGQRPDRRLQGVCGFDTPSYDADAQASGGFPSGAELLRDRIQTNDAFVIGAPEYNFSMPGAPKSAIDWISRSAHSRSTRTTGCPSRLRRRWREANEACGPCASPSSTWARVPIRTCSRWRGRTRPSTTRDDPRAPAAGALREQHRQLHGPDRSLQGLSLVKRAWVEYLGGHPDPATAASNSAQPTQEPVCLHCGMLARGRSHPAAPVSPRRGRPRSRSRAARLRRRPQGRPGAGGPPARLPDRRRARVVRRRVCEVPCDDLGGGEDVDTRGQLEAVRAAVSKPSPPAWR
jgi:NADPH-dependent FMN reductase